MQKIKEGKNSKKKHWPAPAFYDMLIIFVIGLIIYITSPLFSPHEFFYDTLGAIKIGRMPGRDLPIFLAVLLLCLLVFSFRRWLENRTEVRRRIKVEKDLERYQECLEDLVDVRMHEILELHKQMEFILGATKTGLDIIDSNYNMVYMDKEWQKIYGDPKGKKCYAYFMGRDQVCPDCGITKAFQTKKVVVTEEVLAKEGNRPVQVTTIPYQNVKGEWLVAEVNVDISERKKMENELRKYRDHLEDVVKERTEQLADSEERFRHIFNESIDGFIVSDIDTKRFLMGNRSICAMLGYTGEELKGLSVKDIHPADSVDFALRNFEDGAMGHVSNVRSLPVKRKDGSIFYADISISKIIFSDKEYLVGGFRDVTERRLLEMKILKLSELKKQLIILGDLDKKLKIITEKILDIFGADFVRIWLLKEADLCHNGCRHASVVEGAHICRNRDRCLHLIASSGRYAHIGGEHRRVPIGCYKIGLIASGECQSFITNDVTHDKRVHDHKWAESLGLVSFAGYRLTSVAGEPIGVLALFCKHPLTKSDENLLNDLVSSVSHMIMAEMLNRDIKISEESYHTIFESANDAMLIRDIKTYDIIDVNHKACELFCYPREGMIGLKLGVLHKDSFQHPFEKFISFFEKAANGEMQVFEWISKDRFEREFWVEMSVKRVIIGGQYRFLCVVRDITESKQAMMQKEKFINMVSHELRTPLAAIKESISIIIDDKVGATNNEQHEVLEIGKSNIDRLSRLIDQVLDFQKISAGRMDFKFKENNINDVVREVHRSMLSAVSKKGLKFILKFDNKLPAIKFDEDKIIEVLNNLVNNAVKFTETGSIVITTSLGNDFVQVRVSDTGIGIKKNDIPKLFQSFSQLEGKSGGTGLGLAICKELIEKHKGKIWAESEFGKGSTFTFILPLNEVSG